MQTEGAASLLEGPEGAWGAVPLSGSRLHSAPIHVVRGPVLALFVTSVVFELFLLLSLLFLACLWVWMIQQLIAGCLVGGWVCHAVRRWCFVGDLGADVVLLRLLCCVLLPFLAAER